MSYQQPKTMRGTSKPSKTALYVSFLVIALLLLLGTAIGVFVFDSLSRSSFNRAWTQVVEMEESGSYKSSMEMQQLMGRQPAHIDRSREGAVVERYTWRRGIPSLTFDIYIVYATNRLNEDLHYYSSSANAPPESFPKEAGQIIITNPENPPGG